MRYFPAMLREGRQLLARCMANRELLLPIFVRDLQSRYRGSLLGGAWLVLSPLLLLVIYGFVFGVIFSAKWPNAADIGFTVSMFAGINVFIAFAEVVNRAPVLIRSHPNYVKKIVFPLEVLSLSSLGCAMTGWLIGTALLMAYLVLWLQTLSVTVLAIPLVLVPFMIMLFALSLLLSALGVFLPDVTQLTGFATTAMLFLSPTFYPMSAVPDALQPWMHLNPLTIIVESYRGALLFGQWPDWGLLALYLVVALLLLGVAAVVFERLSKGFSDAL